MYTRFNISGWGMDQNNQNFDFRKIWQYESQKDTCVVCFFPVFKLSNFLKIDFPIILTHPLPANITSDVYKAVKFVALARGTLFIQKAVWRPMKAVVLKLTTPRATTTFFWTCVSGQTCQGENQYGCSLCLFFVIPCDMKIKQNWAELWLQTSTCNGMHAKTNLAEKYHCK